MYGRALSLLLLRGWRLWRSNPRLFYYRLWRFTRSPLQAINEIVDAPRRAARVQQSYEAWQRCPTEAGSYSAPRADSPLLSVIMPVHNTAEDVLSEAIESVLKQTYSRWELCIADDASSASHVGELLAQYAQQESRIHVVRRETQGHISAASNSALARASGEFVVLLDHDDLLLPHALAEVANVIQNDPAVDFVYSDEDKLDFDGTRIEPFFKPAWSPTLLTSGNYITHLAAIRRSLVLTVGGFRQAMLGSQDHDLFLRTTEMARSVAHIPQVLYSWRKSPLSTAVGSGAKPYAIEASRVALQETLSRRGVDAELAPSHLNGLFFVRHRVATPVRVSLVTIGAGDEWREIIHSPTIHICKVTALETDERLDDNFGVPLVDEGDDDFLVFLDAAATPSTPESVLALIEYAQLSTVGMVSGMTVHHRTGVVLQAGIGISGGGQPFYAYAGLPQFPQRNFYLNLKDLPREVSAGYVGCTAVRREVWNLLGGWSSDLPTQLAMYDLSLRALARGFQTVYSPLARFERDASLPRIPQVTSYRWAWRHYIDPYWNPNFAPATADGLPFQCAQNARVRVRPGPMGTDISG